MDWTKAHRFDFDLWKPQQAEYVPNEKARLQINNKVSRRNKKIDGLKAKIKSLKEVKAYLKEANEEKGAKIAELEELQAEIDR